MTVDEVARRAGTTSRNVRAYQTKGLLPRPRKSGRVGLYGRLHLARLRVIDNLQKRGYSLAAIGDVLEAWDARKTVGELLGLERALSGRYVREQQIVLTQAQLVRRFAVLRSRRDLWERAVKLELIRPVPDHYDRYTAASPRLLEVAEAMLAAGIPADAALDELAAMRTHLRELAARLVALFRGYVWQPWVDAGRPLSKLPALVRRIRNLRPLPGIAIEAVLAQALDAELSETVNELLTQARTSAPSN